MFKANIGTSMNIERKKKLRRLLKDQTKRKEIMPSPFARSTQVKDDTSCIYCLKPILTGQVVAYTPDKSTKIYYHTKCMYKDIPALVND